MKTLSKLIGAALLVFFVGCSNSQRPVSIVLEGSPETVAAARDWLEKNPQAAESALGGEYIIKTVPPESLTDGKMVVIHPDPDIDFKIRILNSPAPVMTPQMRELSRDIAESIRRDIQRQVEKIHR